MKIYPWIMSVCLLLHSVRTENEQEVLIKQMIDSIDKLLRYYNKDKSEMIIDGIYGVYLADGKSIKQESITKIYK